MRIRPSKRAPDRIQLWWKQQSDTARRFLLGGSIVGALLFAVSGNALWDASKSAIRHVTGCDEPVHRVMIMTAYNRKGSPTYYDAGPQRPLSVRRGNEFVIGLDVANGPGKCGLTGVRVHAELPEGVVLQSNPGRNKIDRPIADIGPGQVSVYELTVN
jgi:hypothetical protein